MINIELAKRFVAGETLEGENASDIMNELTTFGAWRIWVQVSISYLELSQPTRAEDLLRQLLANYADEDWRIET